MRDLLCAAFCQELRVRRVPAGLAVSTAFAAADGDRIGFYIKETSEGFRIEDDGLVLPMLTASGVDFKSGTRADALHELLAEYAVAQDDREFFIGGLHEDAVPAAALRFVAFSLRIRDFMLMTEYRVATSFREDAAEALKAAATSTKASFQENAPVSEAVAEFSADFVMRAPGRRPVGVFLGINDSRILEALFLHMRARHEVKEDCGIVALLESGHSISARVRQQAMNRLDAVTEFRGDETSAVSRIMREVLGANHVVH